MNSTWVGQLLRPQDAAELSGYLDSFLEQSMPLKKGVLEDVVNGLESWGQSLGGGIGSDSGLPFLKTWWRSSQLKAVLRYEFGDEGLSGTLDFPDSLEEGSWAPVGVVLHWPAANVPIQPFLSLTGGLLSGNKNIVRVPCSLADFVSAALADAPSPLASVLERVLFVTFPSDRHDLAGLCAARSDAAMIWGGQDAVTSVRSLPFPHWAKIEVFGPRISAAMVLLDAITLSRPAELQRLCRRVARETWQFDQQACSSPLALYLQVAEDAVDFINGNRSLAEEMFVQSLAQAFEEEEMIHPRRMLDARASVDIAVARANWLLDEPHSKAILSDGPAWSIFYGGSVNRIPKPINGKILQVVLSDSLEAAASRMNRDIQTIGIWIHDSALEMRIARTALAHGVDRVVRLGLMHVFNTPWDGRELVRPLCRKVHFISSTQRMEKDADA